MKIETHGYSFYVENSWLIKSGTVLFSNSGGHYKYIEIDRRDISIVRISDIDPSIRGKGIPIFNDGETDEGNIKSKDERVLDILEKIKNDVPLYPVEVREIHLGKYRYKLHRGCHRLHLSIVVGFDSIPAVILS